MPIQSLLYGFNKEAVVPKGVITLSIMLGTPPRYLNLVLDFMVLKVPSAYNMILGSLCMRMAKVVLSGYHLVKKFLMKASIGEVRGNQIMV